ncbi:transposase [Alteribacter keqinensis]|uniref:transposase n=1 Tax=Alteribacter keqinensis TaxID=2483800 RepID=UPI0024B62515|nr:transposase [Alteribacter keqinensis]
MRILDSTSFALLRSYSSYRGSTKSGVKIQLEYDILSGEILLIEVQEGRWSDVAFSKETTGTIKEKALLVRDLGNHAIDIFSDILTKNAYFLSRLKTNINVYRIWENAFEPVNLEEETNHLMPGESLQLNDVYFKI